MTLVVAVLDPGAARGFYALVAGCGQCSFFGSSLLFLLSGFFHLFASFCLSACTPAEANQAEGKINRQITSVRRRRRRLDEYFCCSFWAARFLFSSLVFRFLFLFLIFSLSSSLFALSAALRCDACFALFAHRTHCARPNGSLTIPLGSIRRASETDKHYASSSYLNQTLSIARPATARSALRTGCVRRFNCVTHARTLLPFFRLPGLLFFPVSSPSLFHSLSPSLRVRT